jgi:hypothetical protein
MVRRELASASSSPNARSPRIVPLAPLSLQFNTLTLLLRGRLAWHLFR